MKERTARTVAAGSSLLTAPEAAGILGVGTSTIKRWADDGRLACVRTAGGHRRFERAVVESFLGREGVASETNWVDGWVERLIGDHDFHALLGALHSDRARFGSWWRLADQVGPVLVDIGRRWSEGKLPVAREHIASERFARSIAAISYSLPVAADAPKALLATAEGDEHSLGLSLAELVFREAGWKTEWVGPRTPIHDVLVHVEWSPPDLVALSASSLSSSRAVLADQAHRAGLACRAKRVRLVLGGSGAWPDPPEWGERIESFERLHWLLSDPARKTARS